MSRKLLVDIGNTNLKWCWFEGDQLGRIESVPHQQGTMPDLPQRCWSNEKRPEVVLVANVAAPQLNNQIGKWISENWGVMPRFLLSQAKCAGVINGYSKPEQLGVDRWLTLIAVYNRYSTPACIVDSGTATTIDLIRNDGQHLGGLILPGFELMRSALLQGTHIPRVDSIMFIPELLGRDTAAAVASACINSAAALVERVVSMEAELLGVQPSVYLTGSDAELLQSAMTVPVKLHPDLVMSGLAIVAAGSIE